MDTWATSSMTPQIAGRMLQDPHLYRRVFPFALRPQAHEIIRTWAFDTIVKSQYNFDAVPWRHILISGWGLAPHGTGKISKSRGGGPMAPMEMVQRYSSDAARYWAASTGPGKDATISEDKIAAGAKLATKLWNVARLAERFFSDYEAPSSPPAGMTVADRWILSQLQGLVESATDAFEAYDYVSAKNDVEIFFWTVLTDNYLEMAKGRLYTTDHAGNAAARFTLHTVLRTVLELFAPVLPFVTDEIYRALFTADARSIHRAEWPSVRRQLLDAEADALGSVLVAIATAVRRYKSEGGLSLGAGLPRLQIAGENGMPLRDASEDIRSVTRAEEVQFVSRLDTDLQVLIDSSSLQVGV